MKQDISIRQALPEDAAQFLELQKKLAVQTNFLLLTPQEASEMPLPRQTQIFQDMLAGKLPQTVLVAVVNGHLAGFLGFGTNGMSKARHIANRLAVGVEDSFHRQGIATALFAYAEESWQKLGISRVEFTVITENASAIKFYSKLGYQIEGERKQAVRKPGGGYYNEYYMAKVW